MSLETDSTSLAGLLHAVAAAYVLGAPVRHEELFRDRFARPLPLDKEFRFFASPCERRRRRAGDCRPVAKRGAGCAGRCRAGREPAPAGAGRPRPDAERRDALDVLRRLAAERAELPLEAVSAGQQPAGRAAPELDHGRPDRQPGRPGTGAHRAAGDLRLRHLDPGRAGRDARRAGRHRAEADDERGRADRRASRPGCGPSPSTWCPPPPARRRPRPHRPRRAGSCSPPTGTRWPPPLRAALRRRRARRRGAAVPAATTATRTTSELMLAAARAALSLAGAGPVRGRSATGGARRAWPRRCTWRRRRSPPPWSPCRCRTTLAPSRAAGAPRHRRGRRGDHRASARSCYDADGTRRVPVLRPLPARRARGAAPRRWTRGDVLLVTGGGKGITAECALGLAAEHRRGDRPAGPVRPGHRPGAGGEPGADGARRASATTTCGPTSPRPTRSRPRSRRSAARSARSPRSCTAPAATSRARWPTSTSPPSGAPWRRRSPGWRAVLAADRPGPLRLLVTFGSIIGRAGLRGEARLRHRQRLADRPDPPGRRGLPETAGAWRWSGRCGPAPAWASGSACWSR